MIPILFFKGKIPKKLPSGMQRSVDKLKKSKNKQECLRKAYDIITDKHIGCRFYTYLKFFNLFESDLEKIWHKKGCMHCNHFTYLLRVLLVKSGFFKDKEIKLKHTLSWYISPHQYLRIRLSKNKYINVDAWGKAKGIKFGEYARGFR